jgi:hypothetical protein
MSRSTRIADALVAVVLGALLLAPTAGAQIPALLVSGEPVALIVDGDGDGPVEDGGGPDSDDCRFMAFMDAVGNLMITSIQDANTPLRGCGPTYFGFAFGGPSSSSNFAEAVITSATSSFGALPVRAELDDEVPNPSGLPAGFDDPTDRIRLFNNETSQLLGQGQLCQAGELVTQVTLKNGMSVVRSLSIFVNPESGPNYLCGNMPFEQASPNQGMFVMRNAYIPLTSDNRLTVASESAPTTRFVDIDLDNLPACTQPAPTTTVWGVVGALLALLLLGSWGLSRRPAFYRSLPAV